LVAAGIVGGVLGGAVLASAAASKKAEEKEREREEEDLGGSWIDTIQTSQPPPHTPQPKKEEREYTLPAYPGLDMGTQVWASPEPMRMPEPQPPAKEEERRVQVEPFDPFADR